MLSVSTPSSKDFGIGFKVVGKSDFSECLFQNSRLVFPKQLTTSYFRQQMFEMKRRLASFSIAGYFLFVSFAKHWNISSVGHRVPTDYPDFAGHHWIFTVFPPKHCNMDPNFTWQGPKHYLDTFQTLSPPECGLDVTKTTLLCSFPLEFLI